MQLRAGSGTTSTVGSRSSVSPGFRSRFYLNVDHVDLLVHKENWGPLSPLSPVLRVGDFFNGDVGDFRVVILEPLSSYFLLVDKGHVLSFAVLSVGMLVRTIRSMIIISFMHDNPNDTVLPSRFWVLDRLEPELMINISHIEDVV